VPAAEWPPARTAKFELTMECERGAADTCSADAHRATS